MSDRIRYPVGNTAGRDHIQNPTILRSEIDPVTGVNPDQVDIVWPVEITLAQIMALCWRVKKWRLSGDASVTIDYFDPGPGPGLEQTISATGTASIAETDIFPLLNGAPVIRERDLVGQVFDPVYQGLKFDQISFETSLISDWTASGSDQIGAGAPSPWFESGSDFVSFGILGFFVLFDSSPDRFSPSAGAFGNLIPVLGGSGSTRMGLGSNCDKNPDTVGGGSGPFALKAPGTITVDPGIADSFEIPIQLSWRLTGMANTSSSSGSGSGDFLLEAVEFFPYENSENLPVWDSATGAQLLDPFS